MKLPNWMLDQIMGNRMVKIMDAYGIIPMVMFPTAAFGINGKFVFIASVGADMPGLEWYGWSTLIPEDYNEFGRIFNA